MLPTTTDQGVTTIGPYSVAPQKSSLEINPHSFKGIINVRYTDVIYLKLFIYELRMYMKVINDYSNLSN